MTDSACACGFSTNDLAEFEKHVQQHEDTFAPKVRRSYPTFKIFQISWIFKIWWKLSLLWCRISLRWPRIFSPTIVRAVLLHTSSIKFLREPPTFWTTTCLTMAAWLVEIWRPSSKICQLVRLRLSNPLWIRMRLVCRQRSLRRVWRRKKENRRR